MIFKIICSARRPYPVALPNHWYIAAHPDVGYPALLLPGQSSQRNIFRMISVLQMFYTASFPTVPIFACPFCLEVDSIS